MGYFEGIDSERGIARRLSDSTTLREFLRYELSERTPGHSTISRNRRLIALEAHQDVFTWILTVLGREGLLRGKTLGVGEGVGYRDADASGLGALRPQAPEKGLE